MNRRVTPAFFHAHNRIMMRNFVKATLVLVFVVCVHGDDQPLNDLAAC